jgi:hypothetical protein
LDSNPDLTVEFTLLSRRCDSCMKSFHGLRLDISRWSTRPSMAR